MEVIGTVVELQLVLVVLACVAGFFAIASSRTKVRSFAVFVQLAAFLVSFAVGGFYLTFLERSFIAAVGPCMVLLVLAFSVWRIRIKSKQVR